MWNLLSRFLVTISRTPVRVLVSAAVFALLFGFIEWRFTDYLLTAGSGANDSLVDGIETGVLTGGLIWVLLSAVHYRRQRAEASLRQIAELNHHVRNALTVIQYQSALSAEGSEAAERVEEAVRRIDAALKSLDVHSL